MDAIQASTLWRECPQVDDDSRFIFMEALSEAMATDTVVDDAQAEDTGPATTPATEVAAIVASDSDTLA